MTSKDKTPDKPETDEAELRTRHFLEIERARAGKSGAKEMAMTKKHRAEVKDGDRTHNFVEIEKGRKA